MRTKSIFFSLLWGAIFLAWFVYFRPSSLGGPISFILVTGHSMEPTFYTGDLVVMRTAANYGVSDVIAFKVPGGRVIHRIVGGSADEGFVTLGDNNAAPDPWKPKYEDVLGRQWLFVPQAGKYIDRLRQPRNLALILGLLLSFAFFDVLLGPASPKGRRQRLMARRRRRASAWSSF